MFSIKTDAFMRFMLFKSRSSWSSTEVLDIFKHRYGEAYDVALANTLMDALRRSKMEIRKTPQDRKYEKMWEGVLDEKRSLAME